MIDVRGRGLMVGVEFGGQDSSNRLKADKGVAMVGVIGGISAFQHQC